MKFTTNFTSNSIFRTDHLEGVENFCQVLKAVSESYLTNNGALSPEELEKNYLKSQEIKKMVWIAKNRIVGKTIFVRFKIFNNSHIFKNKDINEVKSFLQEAFELYWKNDALLRENDDHGDKNPYLDQTEIHYRQVFSEALDNVVINGN